MESTDFIERLKELAANENLMAVSQEVNELRTKFGDFLLEEERKAQVAKLEAQERGEEVEESTEDFGKEAFYEIYAAYKTARKSAVEELKATEERNLSKKTGTYFETERSCSKRRKYRCRLCFLQRSARRMENHWGYSARQTK